MDFLSQLSRLINLNKIGWIRLCEMAGRIMFFQAGIFPFFLENIVGVSFTIKIEIGIR